jgi:hypothetical protein
MMNRLGYLSALGSAAALFATGGMHVLAAQPAPAEVFVVSTLYRHHETTPAYDLAALGRVIERIRPDVLVLDVTPDELREQKVFPSKIEYPGTIFPLVQTGRYKVYASEPAEPMFSEIVQGIIAESKALAEEKPDTAAAMRKLQEGMLEALRLTWRSPADVHSERTDQAIRHMRAIYNALSGPAQREGQHRWNRHHADVVLQAARENPGKRVIQFVGLENRYEVLELLRNEPSVTLVDVSEYLRANGSQ